MSPTIGVCFDRTYPAGSVADFARRVEEAGLDQLWLIEDCFFTAGVTLTAAALTATESITVGLGILPVVARNPAITAMELATLANLSPGRLVAGLGHGVQSWMGQMGARKDSPLTVLTETFEVVGPLLDGETVDYDGRYVSMNGVRLEQPPMQRPDLVAGVNGPRSMAVAGRVADGVVLAGGAGPEFVVWALDAAGRPEGFVVDLFSLWSVASDRETAYRRIAPVVVELAAGGADAFTHLPFYDEMHKRVEAEGAEALVTMPADYWHSIGAIGTPDDAATFIEYCEQAGARSVSFFPGPEPAMGLDLIDDVATFLDRR